MQRLAYKDPSGGIHLLTGSLPPLAPGYEWTKVIDADPATGAEAEEAEEFAEAEEAEVSATRAQLSARRRATRRPRRRQPSQQPGIVDSLIPLLTPRPAPSRQATLPNCLCYSENKTGFSTRLIRLDKSSGTDSSELVYIDSHKTLVLG